MKDIEWDPDVSLMVSEDEGCVCDARALELVELSESEAAAWLLGVTSAEVAVNVVGPAVEP